MSKYKPLWDYVAGLGGSGAMLSFAQIERILGFPLDHSFLQYKKELTEYGYAVKKISQKAQTVSFEKEKRKT